MFGKIHRAHRAQSVTLLWIAYCNGVVEQCCQMCNTGVENLFTITGRINGEIYRWRAGKTIELIQKSNLHLAMRDKGFS